MKNLVRASVVVVAAIGLAACSSSDDDPAGTMNTGGTTGGDTTGGDTTGDDTTGGNIADGVSGSVLRWGSIEVFSDAEEVSAFAGFGQFTTALTASQFNDELDLRLDTCVVSTFTFDPTDDNFTVFDADFTSLSAGETITISSPAGTYATLDRVEFGDFIVYESGETGAVLLPPAPSGLTVDIPGDEFQAYSNVAIPDVQPMVITAPTESTPVTPSTAFSWQPAPASEANRIVALSVSAFTTDGSLDVDCVLADDGSFSFPAATQAEMGASFSGDFFELTRSEYRFLQNGNEVLLISNSN